MPTISKNDFLAGLKKSNVIESEKLEEWLASGAYETPQAIAAGLVKSKMLTKWQAKFLMSGRSRLDLGSYRLLERVQRDELGDRFLAVHKSLNRKVDIQVLPAELTKDTKRFNTFIKKSTTAAKLDHPNIVHVYDIDQEGGRYFLVTEHFEGVNLSQKPKSELSEAFIAKLTREVVNGLKHAHEHEVVHGSISPLDLVFTNDGSIKLDHVALSPLRDDSESADPSEVKDYSAIAKIGLALTKNLSEDKKSSNFDALKLALASIQTGRADVVDQALSSLEKMDFVDAESELEIDPLAVGSGGFDSPMPTTQVRKPKKQAAEETDEDEEILEPFTRGIIGTLWHSNPVAVIATSAVLGLLTVGGAIFGFMYFGDDPVVKNNTPKANVKNLVDTAAEDSKRDVKLTGTNTDAPDFSDTKAMEERIAMMLDGNSGLPANVKNNKPKNTKPNKNKDGTKDNKEAYPFKSPVTKDIVQLDGGEIPANTPLDIKFISEEGWAEVEFKLADNKTKSGWIKAAEIAEAATAPVENPAVTTTTPVSLTPGNGEAMTNAVVATPATNTNVNNTANANAPANNGLTATPAKTDPETKPGIPDPLDQIFGIGDKTQQALYESGILTFKQLGSTTPQKIRVALGTKIARRTDADFNKWINEARKLAGMEGTAPATGTSPSTAANPAPDKSTPNGDANANPFAKFPRITGLPEVADTKEMKIAPLTIKKTYLLSLEIICEEGFSRTKLIFELTRGDKAGGKEKSDKQKWFVGVKRRASEKPDNIGVFRKSEDAVYFQWLPEAEKNKYAEYLRNCFIRLKLPPPDGSQSFLSLRRPMKVHDLRINAESLFNKLEFTIPAMPDLETVVMEVTPMRVKGTETTVIQPRIEKGLPAMIHLKKRDKTGFLRLQVAGEIKSKVRLQSNLILLAQGQAQPVNNLAMMEGLQNQIAQQKAYFQGELQKAKTQGEKDSARSKISKSDATTALLLTYQETLTKLWNQPISIRVYSKLGNYQLLLAQSDASIEQPTKRRK